MSTHSRPYLFDVRPAHRETVASYTRRLLTANFETEAHQRQLVREVTASQTIPERATAWRSILTKKTKRTKFYFDPHPTAWLRHSDGSSCEHCATHLGARWMCRHCANGNDVEQNPHFDNLVCIRHRRWVGLTTEPADQHHIGEAHITAALLHKKLVRTGRLDTHLYRTLYRSVRTSLGGKHLHFESAPYPAVVALAATITSADFARRFFGFARYAQAHTYLADTVAEVLERPNPEVVRAIWLYARPTFWALRGATRPGITSTSTWAHDLYVHPSVDACHESSDRELEPFENYLAVTGDTVVTAAQYGRKYAESAGAASIPQRRTADGSTLIICNAGHQSEVPTASILRLARNEPVSCPLCRHRVIRPGVNDLATTHPSVAAEFCTSLNNGWTAQDVGASSNKKYNWRCPKDHVYAASPNNRTSAKSGCPVCMNRIVVFGLNDLTSTHPELVAQWDPAWLDYLPPSSVTAGSKRWVAWLCAQGHRSTARICDRADGTRCPDCENERVRDTEQHLWLTHPHLAAEWHPTFNGTLRPEHRTAGSADEVYWLCPEQQHHYRERIERRARGYKCKVCSHRGGVVSGVNDLATTHPSLVSEWHPYMNGAADPKRLFAGTELRWWLCAANKHKTQQSVPNRIKSKGCTDCSPAARILATVRLRDTSKPAIRQLLRRGKHRSLTP